MSLSYAVVVGLSVGVVVGVGALQLRTPSLVQSLVAVLAAVLLSTGGVFLLGDTGEGYFSVGVEELVRVSLLLAASAALHLLLGVFDASYPSVLRYRPLALSCAAALYASIAVAIAINSISKLNLS